MQARRLGLIVSRLPSLESGEAPRLTAVAVEDLLLRPSEKIDYARLEALVKGKSVIVTGGGGSIGAEICERLVTFGAARLLLTHRPVYLPPPAGVELATEGLVVEVVPHAASSKA